MPLYEFTCREHGKFERLMPMGAQVALCEAKVGGEMMDGTLHTWQCGVECPKIEFSVPARRDPEKGIQR